MGGGAILEIFKFKVFECGYTCNKVITNGGCSQNTSYFSKNKGIMHLHLTHIILGVILDRSGILQQKVPNKVPDRDWKFSEWVPTNYLDLKWEHLHIIVYDKSRLFTKVNRFCHKIPRTWIEKLTPIISIRIRHLVHSIPTVWMTLDSELVVLSQLFGQLFTSTQSNSSEHDLQWELKYIKEVFQYSWICTTEPVIILTLFFSILQKHDVDELQ